MVILMSLVIRFYVIALMGHFIAYPRYLNSNESLTLSIVQTIIFPAAFWLLSKPGISTLRLVALLQMVVFWEEMPRTGSHWFMMAAASLTFICIDYRKHAKLLIMVLQIIFLISYFFSFFAKLNHGFFSEKSCAQEIFSVIMPNSLSFQSGTLAIFATITEATIFVLLALAASLSNKQSTSGHTVTKFLLIIGITTAILFHGALAFATQFHIADFTVTVYFFLAAFLISSARNTVQTPTKYSQDNRLYWVMTLTFITLFFLISYKFSEFSLATLQYVLLVIVVVTAILLSREILFQFSFRRQKESIHKSDLLVNESYPTFTSQLAAVFIFTIVSINGLAPYIGIKDTYSFTMYSNLQLAQGRANHMLIQRPLSIFQDSNTWYEVQASNDKNIRLYKKTGYLVSAKNLFHYLSEQTDTLAIVSDNQTMARFDSHNMVKPGLMTRKFRSFRAVDMFQPPRCQTVWLPLD